MAFTSPPTKAAGNPTLFADWNTYIRDNTNFLYAPPRCRVYAASDQSIATGTHTAITFTLERYDNDTMHSTSSNTSRITFTTGGVYHVGGNVEWAPNDTGFRQVGLRVNGSTFIAVDRETNPDASDAVVQQVFCDYSFSASDYVELVVQHTRGSNLSVQVKANWSNEFWAHWVSN